MDIGLGTPALYLLLTGGFAVALLSAAGRRDGPAVLAMASAGLVVAHLAGLPAPWLVWGCIAVAVAIGAGLAATVLRWCAGGEAFRVGAALTALVLTLVATDRSHRLADRPIALGRELHGRLTTLIDG